MIRNNVDPEPVLQVQEGIHIGVMYGGPLDGQVHAIENHTPYIRAVTTSPLEEFIPWQLKEHSPNEPIQTFEFEYRAFRRGGLIPLVMVYKMEI